MEKETLIDFGLNEKEASIYLQLLKEKSCSASRLAKIAKINRTTAYLELDNLMKQGLVSYVIKDSKRYYQASHPDKLLDILEHKKNKIKAILPKLEGLHATIDPFKIEVFEGKDGIKTFYQSILRESGEVLAFGVTGLAYEVLKFDFPHIVNEMKKRGVRVRYLANHDSKSNLKKLPKSRAQIKYLPKEYSSEITTIIHKNKIAIQSLVENNIFVVVITDTKLAIGYKNYFEFMWKLI